MNVVFLDIDGVLNTWRFVEIQERNNECNYYEAQFNFDPICMKNLKDLVETFDARIVVSSTWRLHYNSALNPNHWIEMIRNLDEYGLKDRVIGVTPRLSSFNGGTYVERGNEIQDWLNTTDVEVTNFVILDDDADMAHLVHKLAKSTMQDGFTDAVKQKAFEILSKEISNDD